MLILAIGLVLGALMGSVGTYYLFPKAVRHGVDYKERWESAVALLGDAEISYEDAKKAGLVKEQPKALSNAEVLKTLHAMQTWDRADLEIKRAKAGLAPVDDLVGMQTWDVKAVMEARMKHGTA